MNKEINMYYRMMIFILSSAISPAIFAEGLYLQQLNKAQLSEAQIQQSQKKLTEHKPVVIREKLAIAPFHKRGQMQVQASLEHSFCTGCHLSPPHTQYVRTRTFMNMHTQFIACETCHFRPEGVELSYQWQDVRDEKSLPAAPTFFRTAKKLVETPLDVPVDKQTSLFYKITPFYGQEAVILGRKSAFSQETMRIWKTGSLAEKSQRRALIHAPLQEKGPECSACHDKEKNLLDLGALGANTHQIEQIQNNIITQFFTDYEHKEKRIRIMGILQ